MRDICFVLTFVTSSSSYDASLLFFSILFYISFYFFIYSVAPVPFVCS